MAQNNFLINLIAGLSKTKSKQQIKSDTKSLGDMYVKLIGNLDMPKTRKAIKAQLKGLNNLKFNITPNVNTKGVQSATRQAVNNAQKVANNNKVHLNFDTSKQQLVNQIKILGRNNNKLFNDRDMTAKYNQLLNSANVAKSTGELKTLRGELSAFKTELVATNNAGMTWGSKFKESIKSYAKFFSGASMIYALSNQIRNAATEAKTLDDRMVDLQKVTDEIGDRDALYKYFNRAMSKANELNVKVDSLIYAITEFKKLGWSLSDAELGGQWATILENVGDVDIDTAIGSIKTSIASFDEIGGYGNDQMDKKLEAYTDLVNEMSNKYSIDAEGLAEAIRISAGTLTQAHTSIEQAATMFATANKFYNDPNYLGNTAKIGSLRLRASQDADAKQELEELGEDIDDVSQSASKLQEKLLKLTGVDIMEADGKTFKSFYDQLYEISQVMDKLSDTDRANVLETIFGKARAAGGAALLSGMKESADAYNTAINSAGSATKEYETWMQSADAACQKFSNTLTETYQSIINGNTVRDLANLGSAVLEFANNWGIVEGTLKGVIALGIGKFLTTGTMALITATKQVEQYGKALQLASNVPNGNLSARFQALKSIAQATSTLTTEQLKNVLATNTLTQADRVRILQMQGMTKEMALQKLAEMNLTQATNAQTAANTASTASTFSLKAAMTGLGATLKGVFLSNPVGIALMAISIGVSAITSAVSNHNQKMEEARQKAKEAADTANTLGDEIADLANKYIQLSDAVKTDASAKEDLMTTQTELLKKLGLEGESIDDLIAKYGSLSNAIKQASIDSLKGQQIDLVAGVNAAKEELMDVAKDNFFGTNNIISVTGDEAVKAFKELEKAGVINRSSYGTGGGQLVLTGDNTVEGAIENFNRLEQALQALRDSEALTAEELSDNPLYQAIYARYSEMKESVEEYNSSIDNLNENLAQQTMLTALQGSELPKTEEDFNTFRQELIDTAVASKQFIGDEKEITDAINNYLSTVPEFEGYYSIPLENELDKVDELLNQEDFSKTSFIQSISGVQELSAGFDKLDKIYADVLNKEDFDWSTILNNDDFTETFGSMENVTEEYKTVYDDFIRTVSNNSKDIDACQDSFDRLATAYIQNSGALNNLTEETKQATITMLEEMGIENAEEVVTATLAQNKEELALQNTLLSNTTSDLSSVTAAEIQSLMDEGTISQDTAQKMAGYALEKQLCNVNTINTAADCQNIIRLAQVAGAGVEALQKLEALKQRLSENPIMADSMRANITNKIKEIVGEVNASMNVTVDVPQAVYKGATATKKAQEDATKSASDTASDIKDQIEAYLKYLEKSLDAGKIDYQTYCNTVKNYLDDMHKSGKISAKDYFDYIEKALEKQKSVLDKVLSAVVKRFEKEMDCIQEKIDSIESENDLLNSNLSNMDSALNAVDKVYDTEIDRIQAIIDGLKDANDERDRALALEKAKYQLEKAYNNRIIKQYIEGKGYVYSADFEAIRDAQKSYDDAELDLKTSELSKQVSELEKFKAQWDSVKDAYQDNIDSMNAIALWGSEYQKLILNNNILDVENFKNQYVGIQQKINSNEELIKSYEEKKNYYDKLKSEWSALSDEYENKQNEMLASQVLGANWENDVLNGRLSTLDGFRTQYISVQQALADAQWQSANEQIKALQALADAAWASANEQINAAKEAQKAASGSTGSAGSVGSAYNVSGMISAGAPTSVINKITGNKSNTSAAATADQRKNNSNIIMSNEQKKTIAASKKRANNIRKYANGGVVKINPDDLLADLAKQHGEDGFVMARNGERVLTPNQNASFEKFVDLITGMNITPQMLMPDFMKAAQTVTNNNRPNYSVNMGDVVLNGVQNPDQLADAIIKYMPGTMKQKLSKSGR